MIKQKRITLRELGYKNKTKKSHRSSELKWGQKHINMITKDEIKIKAENQQYRPQTDFIFHQTTLLTVCWINAAQIKYKECKGVSNCNPNGLW